MPGPESAELAGEIELTARDLQQLQIQLQALDRTLALFGPPILPECRRPKGRLGAPLAR